MMNLIGTSDGTEISSISYSTANPYDTQSSNTIKQLDFSKSLKQEEDSIDIFNLQDLDIPEGMD